MPGEFEEKGLQMADEEKFEDVEVVIEDVEVEDVQPDSEVEPDPEVEAVPESESDDGAAEPDGEATGRAIHDERVAAIAERIAAFVAKGEEVIAALEAKADAAEVGEKTRAASSAFEDFTTTLQTRVEKVAEQLAQDLDVIASAVYGKDVDDAEPEEAEPYQPQFTPAASALRERMRVGSGSDLLLTDPEFVERFANFAFDDVPTDVDLPDRTRFMCWLATLLGCQGVDEFRALLPAALNVGLEPEAVKEVVYQAVAYLGIGRVYPFLKATNEVLVAAGVELPLKPQATTLPTEESRYEGGEKAQVACFGEQMHGYKDRGAADYPHIAQWLVKNCFGDWYTRGGLTIAEREMVTFCFIAAQGGCEAQLRAHTAGNVQCGNDRAFLIKVVSNNVPFIGYPRSLNAMAIVEEVTGSKE